ncbi:MAG: hypothetical protein IJ206_09240 [Oscillospiraceae bacterium]|nr:hypothetical protein [Oscillospiraceae bacterium]
MESKIVWNLPGERALDRIEELLEYLENFPEGMMAETARHELERLEQLTIGL